MMVSDQYILCLLLTNIAADNLNKDNVKVTRDAKTKPTTTTASVDKRFLDDLDDKDWHVSHLKDLEFDINGDCGEETFENKAKKYRKTLKNDAALIEFVSGDALQDDNEDILKDRCKLNITNIFKTTNKTKQAIKLNNIANTNEKNPTSSDEVKPATVSMKKNKAKDENIANITNKRRSEYQFSSVEYYDEIIDFDKSMCPDAVEVITLELDQLRSYDIECEKILEWRSLE